MDYLTLVLVITVLFLVNNAHKQNKVIGNLAKRQCSVDDILKATNMAIKSIFNSLEDYGKIQITTEDKMKILSDTLLKNHEYLNGILTVVCETKELLSATNESEAETNSETTT